MGIVALLVIGALLAVFFIVAKTSSLNGDLRQQELAARMLIAVEEDRALHRSGQSMVMRLPQPGKLVVDGPRSLDFAWNSEVVPYFKQEYGELPFGQRQTRAAHALSLIKAQLSESEYEILKGAYCRTLPHF